MDIQVSPEFSDLLDYAGVDGAMIALTEMGSEGPRLIAVIETGVTAGNLLAAMDAAHSLKSSCGALSMNACAELAEIVETAARTGECTDLSETVVELRARFDQELAAIRDYVERKVGNGAPR